jgi:hypothetical protein
VRGTGWARATVPNANGWKQQDGACGMWCKYERVGAVSGRWRRTSVQTLALRLFLLQGATPYGNEAGCGLHHASMAPVELDDRTGLSNSRGRMVDFFLSFSLYCMPQCSFFFLLSNIIN